jgi:tetratricopeptide (TPR) repeat protein
LIMDTIRNYASGYRYPGARPFYDTDIDRCLFFGRDHEKESLLHKVLADNLVVLYAKSGLGKTSLINAGLNQALRDRNFIPLIIRLNDPESKPVECVYTRIEEVARQKCLDYKTGEEGTLWQFFKTVELWSSGDELLKPVLIFDQFEEFFLIYSAERRSRFIQQLGDLINNNIPRTILKVVKKEKPFRYSEKPPNVKIIISIREDYLGHLEEMSSEIPDILQNYFRLLPLTREQARHAIVKPCEIEDEVIHTPPFKFAPEAVEIMLNFLCKRRERGEVKITNEVESFQLQLLCRYIENKINEGKKVRVPDEILSFDKLTFLGDRLPDQFSSTEKHERTIDTDGKIVIQKGDLGGESTMQRILKRFYDEQIEKLDFLWEKRRVRKLCEKGLISTNNRRLSLDEGEIECKFRVSRDTLLELVSSRVLRSEPRLDSVYYELCHDNLIPPIRESQKRHRELKRAITGLVMIIGIVLMIVFIKSFNTRSKSNANSYLEMGQLFYNEGDFDGAIKIYNKAINNEIKNASIYYNLGQAYFAKKNLKDAIKNYKCSLEFGKENLKVYKELALAYIKEDKPDEAINVYREALRINKESVDVFKKIPDESVDFFKEINDELEKRDRMSYVEEILDLTFNNYTTNVAIYIALGDKYSDLGKYSRAIISYEKAISIGKEFPYAYFKMGITFRKLGKYNEAIEALEKAVDIYPEYIHGKAALAETYLITGHFERAIDLSKEILQKKDITIWFVYISSLLFKGEQSQAKKQLQKLIDYYKSLSPDYKITWNKREVKKFISDNKKLPQDETKFLLQLLEILESPKADKYNEIEELEKSIPTIFK